MRTTELAEEYRVKLGLRTWEDQEKWAAEKRESLKEMLSPEAYAAYEDRQSGRTTRGLLYTIARAIRVGAGDVIVEGVTEDHEHVLVDRARELVSKLRLDLRVVSYRRSRTAHFVDHLVER